MGDMVTGGQLVARMLKKEGVRHIFTLSGLHVAPIYAGCVEEGIQVREHGRGQDRLGRGEERPRDVLVGFQRPEVGRGREDLQAGVSVKGRAFIGASALLACLWSARAAADP